MSESNAMTLTIVIFSSPGSRLLEQVARIIIVHEYTMLLESKVALRKCLLIFASKYHVLMINSQIRLE